MINPDIYPQSPADSHAYLQERAIEPHSAPGPMAIIRGRIDQAVDALTAANIGHAEARLYAFNALTGQKMTAEQFGATYQPGTVAHDVFNADLVPVCSRIEPENKITAVCHQCHSHLKQDASGVWWHEGGPCVVAPQHALKLRLKREKHEKTGGA